MPPSVSLRLPAVNFTIRQTSARDVPAIEAEQIVNTLKARGVPVEYILFPDEGHGFRKTQNHIESTVAMVEFFDKYRKAGE
jgi:dipeptidyl aminopeptidase/acylaminoacyl peptidase